MSLPRIRSSLPRPYSPETSEFTKVFWQGLAEGRFQVTRCGACGILQFPPRPQCPSCHSSNVSWKAVDGHGVLYASTRIHAAAGPFACMTPYTVGLVDLREGVRVLTRVMHDASSLPPGSPVQLAIIAHTDGPLFVAIRGRNGNCSSTQRSPSSAS